MKKIVLLIFLACASLVQANELHCNCKWSVNQGIDIPNYVLCDNNILCLIDAMGGVESSLIMYDMLDTRRAHLANFIYWKDKHDDCEGYYMYSYMTAFYEVIGKQPKDFAKSMMRELIFQDMHKCPRLTYIAAGWEYMQGDILPLDTTLGKQYLCLASNVSVDSIEMYVLPFWRDSIIRERYIHKHDSILQVWGIKSEAPVTTAVIEHGDTLAYRKIMNIDHYGDDMIYSIYMIDQYDYKPAYYDLYTTLEKRYAVTHEQLGEYAKLWIYNLYIENNIDVPAFLIQEVENLNKNQQ